MNLHSILAFYTCAPEVDLQVSALLQEPARIPRSTFKRAVFWVLSFVVPGLGMFSEAYWVFSVGNLKGIFNAEYKTCWKTHATCSSGLINSLTYTTVQSQHYVVKRPVCTSILAVQQPPDCLSLESESTLAVMLLGADAVCSTCACKDIIAL